MAFPALTIQQLLAMVPVERTATHHSEQRNGGHYDKGPGSDLLFIPHMLNGTRNSIVNSIHEMSQDTEHLY
jgi:hypothetical protein